MYEDNNMLPDGDRTNQNKMYYQNKSQNQQKHSKDNFHDTKSGSSKIHTVKESDTVNENIKYSQDFLRTISVSDENRQSVLFIEEKHHFLLKQISLLSLQDDGILFNQKLQHIGEIITKHYQDVASIRDAFDAIASAAILDSRISAKVALLCCSVWFSSCQIMGLKLHNIFIEALTDKVDGLEVSLEGADQYLVNTASLLSNIFTETKMLSPDELKTIARLIVQVSIALLECHTPLALKTLNIQLMVHGKKLYQSVPDKVESLSISARKLLIARQPPPPSCRIWLTLLADQCLCRLEPLPKYLEDFYSVHFDESQSSLEDKSQNKKGDYNNYSDLKNANTRYGDKSRRSDSSDIYSAHSNGDRNHEYDQKSGDDVFEERNIQHDSSFDSSGVSDANNSENYDSQNISQNSERKPRPILGAGARFGQPTNMPDVNELSNHMNQSNEENLPVFCPTVPPPNFATKQVSKHVTSASQDNIDYWNTPPPPIPQGRRNECSVSQTSSSVLSKRLDLNSWRVETNGSGAEGFEPVSQDSSAVSDDTECLSEYQESNNSSKILLEKIKTNNRGRDESSDKMQQLPGQRSDKKRAGQVFYERKHGGHTSRDKTFNETWDEGEISNLHLNKAKSSQVETDKTRDRPNAERSISNNFNVRDSGRQRGEKGDNRDSNEGSGRPKEQRNERRADKSDRQREKKLSEEDIEVSEERKYRNSGKREQKSGSGRISSRDNLEVRRGASYWTHDDGCDKEYDD